MNKDFDEVYKMKIVKSGKERESKLHNYDLKVIRELIERYETKERVRTRGEENWSRARLGRNNECILFWDIQDEKC